MTRGKSDVKRRKTAGAFFSGVLILTVSNLLVKAAGLLFKIPMNYIVGDTGMGYYNSAYSIYTFFYMISTSGLPVALSVMISEKRARGNILGARRVYRTAYITFAAIGLFSALIMFFWSSGLCGLIRSEKSTLSVMAVAPTMFFVCIVAAYRGFFQGCGNMVPMAVSQLIEAVFKLVCGVGAAMYAIRMGYGTHIVAAYAIAGLTLGTFAEMLYLIIVKLKRGERDLFFDSAVINDSPENDRDTFRRFIKIALPITLSASVMSLTSMVDTALIQRVLVSSGMTSEMAATLFGNYTSLAVPMFNLPPVLVYPVAYSLVPIVASATASGDTKRVSSSVESALRSAIIIGLPCALGMSALSYPILTLFYKSSSAEIAAPLLACLSPASLFVCILAVTNSTLQACGRERLPVISMLVGALVKLISAYLLLLRYGIMGAPISTFLSYIAVTVINFAFVVKCCRLKLHFKKTFLLPLISGVLCAFTAYYSNRTLVLVASEKVACLLSVVFAAAVYIGAILATRAVTTYEIKTLIGKRLIGKDDKTNEIDKGFKKQTENGEDTRLCLSSRTCSGTSLSRGMRVGQRADARVDPQRYN